MSSGINGPLTELQRKALAQMAGNDGHVVQRSATDFHTKHNPKTLTLEGLEKRGLVRRVNFDSFRLTSIGWDAARKVRASERPVGPVE